MAGHELVAVVLWLCAVEVLLLGVAFAFGFLRGHRAGLRYVDAQRKEWEARHVQRASATKQRSDRVTR